MMYVLMALVSAMFFGISAVTVYGYEGLLGSPWVDYVLGWLMGSGVLLALVQDLGRVCLRPGKAVT